MSQATTLHFDPEIEKLAARLHTLRKERGWTLENLAERTNLSLAYLSRLEGGERQPSLAALLGLARVYNLTLSELVAFKPAEPQVVVQAQGATMQKGNGLHYVPLSLRNQPTTLQALRLVVPSDRQGEEQYRHDGEEWLYVLSGRLRLRLEDEVYDLVPGDAAHFDARRPHRLSALDDQDAEVLVVAAVTSVPLLGSYF